MQEERATVVGKISDRAKNRARGKGEKIGSVPLLEHGTLIWSSSQMEHQVEQLMEQGLFVVMTSSLIYSLSREDRRSGRGSRSNVKSRKEKENVRRSTSKKPLRKDRRKETVANIGLFLLYPVARARNVALVLTFILFKPGYWFFRHRGNGWNTR